MHPHPGSTRPVVLSNCAKALLHFRFVIAPLKTVFSSSLWSSATHDPFCFLLTPRSWKLQACTSILTCCIATAIRRIPSFFRSQAPYSMRKLEYPPCKPTKRLSAVVNLAPTLQFRTMAVVCSSNPKWGWFYRSWLSSRRPNHVNRFQLLFALDYEVSALIQALQGSSEPTRACSAVSELGIYKAL